MPPIVSASALVQGYGKRPVINGIDLEIETGALGLLGPNGAGKTTLLRTLATVAPPLGGRLEILGEPIDSERSARQARRDIGYLPQDFGYYPNFSVYDFVRYCAWLRDVPKKLAHQETLDAIESVGLQGQIDDKMKSLSGGMLRRAGIATAIVGSPRLILLDEPTVGLDPAQRFEFRELIRSLDHAAVILSTHLVEDVSSICEDVAVLNQGSILFRGAPADLAAAADPDAPGDSPLERGYMSVLNEGAVSA
ncbi:ATP-binding cassette domain-containing protein [Streptomyces sp. NBC_01214]|uniref:ATP-binding cassette domain-containing protein n=1 Tax=Streptomyces sp. NBC_01214 TaxID=2903777 RepID=UPI002255082A|nr:ATP-binding cassette domain-containing protein [Streptomyces sp. NBC_01214]MCX4805408.1 ATP-binding cassette domain-containing protein [Streptomyces sp. NBC_01214]